MLLVAMATKPKPTPCGPIVSGQVVVQSHKELQLMKEVSLVIYSILNNY
jgi:hypothetical protein